MLFAIRHLQSLLNLASSRLGERMEVRGKMRLVRGDYHSFLPEMLTHLRKSHFLFDFPASVDYLHYVFFYQAKWSLAAGTKSFYSTGVFALGIRYIVSLVGGD